jgi:hypothetical protein
MRRATPTGSAPATEPDHPFVEKRMTETGDDPAADRAAATATDAASAAAADARRRAVQPVFVLLAAVAIAAAVWTVFRFLRG